MRTCYDRFLFARHEHRRRRRGLGTTRDRLAALGYREVLGGGAAGGNATDVVLSAPLHSARTCDFDYSETAPYGHLVLQSRHEGEYGETTASAWRRWTTSARRDAEAIASTEGAAALCQPATRSHARRAGADTHQGGRRGCSGRTTRACVGAGTRDARRGLGALGEAVHGRAAPAVAARELPSTPRSR